MNIRNTAAVGLSGLIFAGTTALVLGSAAPADAGDSNSRHGRFASHKRSSIIVINRSNNFSESRKDDARRKRGSHRFGPGNESSDD